MTARSDRPSPDALAAHCDPSPGRKLLSLRRFTAFALVATAGAAPLGVAQADDDAPAKRGENVAIATVEKDGARAFDAKWQVVRQRGGAIEQRNAATATARCTDCRATAIAFQVVVVEGSPSIINPRNEAVAINTECTRCTVYAGARQFVRVVRGPVRFTSAGRSTLRDVRVTLRALEGQELTPAQLTAAVEEQEARVRAVLDEQLVAKDGRRANTGPRDDREADDD